MGYDHAPTIPARLGCRFWCEVPNLTTLPAGTVTLLFTDIEGSTRLWEEHPEGMKTALESHDRLLRAIIEERDGHVFSTMGDGLAAAFMDAGPALVAALEAQRQLLGTEWDGLSVKVRMGLHTGRPQQRDDDYFGPVVNRCARLMGAGHGGQVLVSAATAGVVGHSMEEDGVALRDLGEYRLKDLALPERIYQVSTPGLTVEFPPLRTLDRVTNNLPSQLTAFFGRKQEQAALEGLVARSRLVTITGVGGGGKTRLALQAAAQLLEQFPDGLWFVDLAPLSDPALIPDALASAMGARPPADRPVVDFLTEHLSTSEMLLVVDNCEHLIDGAGHLIHRLLTATRNLRVLATSREALRIEGEQLFSIPELGLAATDSTAARSMSPAIELFLDRAAHAMPGLTFGDDELEAVAHICRRLDGLPLAIELAAARTAVLSPQQISERLDEVFRLLTGGRRDHPARHQTLEAAITWSYELLDEDERILFDRLSVFPAGFDLQAAETVCAGPEALDVLSLLPNLVAKSLVVVEAPAPDVRRYRLLDALRRYGASRLEKRGELDSIHALHTDYFLSLAEEAEPNLRTEKHGEWTERLRIEYDNLRQAVQWSITSGKAETATRLVGALRRYWLDREDVREGRRWTEAVLELPGDVSDRARAKVLMAAGDIGGNSGEFDLARTRLEEAVALYRSLSGDGQATASELGVALNNLGVVQAMRKEWQAARRHWEESLEIDRRLGEPWGLAVSIGNLALVVARDGDLEEARALAQEALEISLDLGAPRRIADSYHLRGAIELQHGDPVAATEAIQHTIDHGREVHSQYVLAFLRAQLGFAHLKAGDVELASDLFIPNASDALSDPAFQALGTHSAELCLYRAGIDLAVGAPVRAAVGLGVIERLMAEGKTVESAKVHEEYRTRSEDLLDPDMLADALAQGRAMSEEQAVAFIVAPVRSIEWTPGPGSVER